MFRTFITHSIVDNDISLFLLQFKLASFVRNIDARLSTQRMILFSCQLSNFLQRCQLLFFLITCFRRHIEVHGRPTPAVFRNKPHQGGKNSFRLIWTVDSYSRIEEYRLLYRQIKPFHPVSPSQNLTLQSMMYVKLT